MHCFIVNGLRGLSRAFLGVWGDGMWGLIGVDQRFSSWKLEWCSCYLCGVEGCLDGLYLPLNEDIRFEV